MGKFFKIELNPYPCDLYVSYNQKPKQFIKSLKEFKFSKEDIKFFNEGFDYNGSAYKKGKIFLIRLQDIESSADFAGLVAHEAFHVTMDMFDYVGDDYNGNHNAEAYAYMLQYITTQILKQV